MLIIIIIKPSKDFLSQRKNIEFSEDKKERKSITLDEYYYLTCIHDEDLATCENVRIMLYSSRSTLYPFQNLYYFIILLFYYFIIYYFIILLFYCFIIYSFFIRHSSFVILHSSFFILHSSFFIIINTEQGELVIAGPEDSVSDATQKITNWISEFHEDPESKSLFPSLSFNFF